MALPDPEFSVGVRSMLNAVIRDPVAVAGWEGRKLDLALRLTRRARLLARLAAALKAAGRLDSMAPVARDQLRAALIMADARRRLALWELERIDQAMEGQTGVPLIVMKGCTYVMLDLPNAPGRIFADVDLLTGEQHLEAVEQTLLARGWQSEEYTPYDQNYYRRWTHELPPLTHVEREVEIDLHHNILPRTARLKPSSEALLQNSRAIPGSRYRALCNEDIVLHATVHLMFDSDLSDKLRDLVDIADLLNHFAAGNQGFWNALCDRADSLDLQRPLFYAVRYTNRLLGVEVPETVLQRLRRWGPQALVLRFMDRAVPAALYPQHPDRPSRRIGLVRSLLYMRSHWLRMPPWLLAYHLSYKFCRTRFSAGRQNGPN